MEQNLDLVEEETNWSNVSRQGGNAINSAFRVHQK